MVYIDDLDEVRKSHNDLYNDDIVYKTLVDNYIKASIEVDKKKSRTKENEFVDTSKVSEAINALAKYKDEITNKNALAFVEYLNITNEDLRDMIRQGIIPVEIVLKMCKFKGILGGDEE